MTDPQWDYQAASEAIRSARAVLITAGAGFGVDSGLPDFRGNSGFWEAYPPYAGKGLSFSDLANPRWFIRDPFFAWGFYGHRMALYRQTVPHAGFGILRKLAERAELGFFVATSNVDGQFQAAGFPDDRILEIHGSIHSLQCVVGCGAGLASAENTRIDIDMTNMRALAPLPVCRKCGGLMRPNILMFDDAEWDGGRTDRQSTRYHRWLGHLRQESIMPGQLVIVECGAGKAVPSIRRESELRTREFGATLIRINRREADLPVPGIAFQEGALDVLERIEKFPENGGGRPAS